MNILYILILNKINILQYKKSDFYIVNLNINFIKKLNKNLKILNFNEKQNSNNFITKINFNINVINKYINLWIQCENCYELIYKKNLKLRNDVCEHCGYHFKMNSLDRINFLIDKNTWNSFDNYLISILTFDQEKIENYKNKTGLTESIQIGIGKINNINIALGIMDFSFLGGSMGSVVGEKISCLIEYANLKLLPIILICASGGARMQEGSISLMQMAKISSILYNFQIKQKLFYLSVLSSPTTGGVTASFGMLGTIIIAEPNSTIAFSGKRVIEQTLNKIIPEDSQTSEYLFKKGLFDLIVPRNLLKRIIINLLDFHKLNI